jgi:chromosome segregation ATPase
LEQKAEIEEQIFTIDGKIKKLRDLVGDALSESETEYQISDGANIDSFEELLRKLIENHASLSSIKATSGVVLEGNHSQDDDATLHEERSIDMHAKEQGDIDRYKKDLEVALSELEHLKEEGERTLEKQISLSGEVGALSKRIEELQELLNQEEQKSASAREKLNVAVRKGKSLVQQRDSLKQTIGEMSVEMEHLKSEINNREHTIAEHEQKLRQLSTYPDRLKALESESSLLKHRLEETEHHLQEKEYSLKLILNKLGEIDAGGQGHISDPVKKVEWVGKLCSDLHSSVASLEQESRKSKRASELLLAELNEVQERNDSFQEELAKAADELVDLKRERDSAEAAKLEVLSHLEKLSTLHEEEKKSHFYELVELKSSMNQVWKHFSEVQNLLANAFFTDLESFRNLEAGLQSCVKGNNAPNVLDSSFSKEHDILRKSSDNKV